MAAAVLTTKTLLAALRITTSDFDLESEVARAMRGTTKLCYDRDFPAAQFPSGSEFLRLNLVLKSN